MGAVGLQTYIWNNNIKSTLLLLGFPVLLLGMVYAFVLMAMGFGYLPSDQSPGALMLQFAPMALGAALVWFVIAYFSYQTIIDASTGAHPVSRQEAPRVYNLLENLAISRGMQTPTLRLIDTDAMNAFATGLHEGQYSVTVTTGLMEALDDHELEAVLAHEMTHVINRDVRLMVIASIFAGVITLLAQIIYRSIMWSSWTGGDRRRRSGAGAACAAPAKSRVRPEMTFPAKVSRSAPGTRTPAPGSLFAGERRVRMRRHGLRRGGSHGGRRPGPWG